MKSSATRKGKNRAAQSLRLAAWGLIQGHSYLGAYVRRQKARLGVEKALTAAAHKLARIVYNLLRYGVAYMRKDENTYAEQVRERQVKSLKRRAKDMGFELVKMPDPPTDNEMSNDGMLDDNAMSV